jgi:membrane protein YqaA with SNARE-associated domain
VTNPAVNSDFHNSHSFFWILRVRGFMILKFDFIERWYERVKEMARHKHAVRALVLVAFFESFIFPVPTSVLLISLVQANRAKAWRFATICTIASVCGAVIGYLIGSFFFEALARPVLEQMGYADKIVSFQYMVDQWGALAVFGAGITPFPFKVITVLSGAGHLNFIVFILASIASRGFQFFLVAAMVWKFGEGAEALIKKHFATFTIGFFAVVVLAWVAWKMLHG